MTPALTRILVVDDDAALLEALPETLRLRMPDAAVDTADSAVAALDRIASVDYDAIVTDIKMPGLDGLALLERLREVQPDTPALVITGHGEYDLAIRSLRAGAFDYVPKPIDREYFIASLHRAIHVRALRRQVVEQQQALQRRAAALEQVVEARTEELRHRADRARVLAESAASIHSARDLGQILQAVADAACRLSDASVAVAGCAECNPEAGSAAHRPAWDTAFATRRGTPRPSDGQTARVLAACANRHGAGFENGDAPGLGPELPWSLAVPMRSREGNLRGGIILGRHEPPPVAADDDLQLKMRVLARQAEVALENALLYQRERKIAETLQRSLLPGELPDIPGLALDARYLPGRPDAIGGDWYDVFLLPSGQLGVAMGDVAGRGVWAAAVMGQLRNALRAFALEGDPPAIVAARLNRFIPTGTMATLFYMVFDPETMEARYVNLGHVPPVVGAPGAAASFLEGGAPPLGAKLWFTYKENSTVLTPGSTIVLYTDGLVETRGVPIDDGLNRLAHAVASKSNGDIAGLLDHVLASIGAGTDVGDDIALLALRPLPLDSTRLALRLPAVPSSLSQLRQTLRRWLAGSGLSGDLAFEITTACNEACANAIEHAYGPADASFAFEASLVDGRLTVIVSDTGRWRTPHALHHGLGLTIMRALMDTVEVDSGPGGTTVRMQRRVAATVQA